MMEQRLRMTNLHPRSGRVVVYALLVLVACLGIGACASAPIEPVQAAPSSTASLTPQALPDKSEGSKAPTPVAAVDAQPSATQPPTPTFAPTLQPTLTPVNPPTSPPLPSPTLAPSPPPALALAEGEPLALSLGWRVSANSHLSDGTVLYQDGAPVYLITTLGRALYAVDDKGDILWQYKPGGPVYALAALDEDQVAIGDDAGQVTLVHMGGRQIWWYQLGSRVTSLRAWRDGLLAGGWDERLTFLSSGGKVLWQAGLGGPVSGISTLPELALAATQDGELKAFSPDGMVAWRLDVGAPITELEAWGEDEEAIVLVGTRDGRLLALDTQGKLLWQRSLGEASEGGLVWQASDLDGDGEPEIAVGAGGKEPSVALLSAKGEWLWRVSVASKVGVVSAMDVDKDGVQEILAGLASGEILALDDQGRLRGSVHAGLAVWGLEAANREPAGQEASGAPFTALVRADVAAWQLVAAEGPKGGPWLPPPPIVQTPSNPPPVRIGTESGTGQATLVFLGDVAPCRTVEMQLERYGPAYPWSGLKPVLQEADLAVANLECLLTIQGRPLKKSYLMRTLPRWGQTLVEAGLDLVTLANNHALDYEQIGLDDTLETLENLGIRAVGAGRDAEEARTPALLDINGLRVAVLGYAATRWNGSEDVPLTNNIAWASLPSVRADIGAVRDEADFVVVLLHAGTEYDREPSPDQVAVARTAIKAGADLVVGHHPHATQTVEQFEDGLIVYSLGNALFDIPRPEAMQGDLLRVHITADGLTQAELWPFWIEDAVRPRFLDDGQGAPSFRVVYP